MDVGGGCDPVHKVARHALGQGRPPDEQQPAGSVTGEETRSLSRGVPPADEDHVLSPAAPSLDGRGPVGDPAALEIVQRRDRRTTVARTRGDDDGARGDGPPIVEHEGEWGSLGFARMTGEPGCNGGHGEIGSELLGLGETAPGEFLAGDPGGKAEVVLDACAGARLTPEAPTVDDENRQALRCRIDRGGKPSWAGPHHGDVIATFPD